MTSLNLARSPFVNRRPLQRTGRALAVIGAVLLLVNGVLFWRYLSSSAELRGKLREVRAQSDEEIRSLREIERQLRSFDLEDQNQRVRFLNGKIAQRSFGWSQLFEELGDVLPRNVKLYNLSPSVERRRGRRDRTRPHDWERVILVMSGVAKDTEPLLELIDALFEHPAFEEPRLSGESREENGQIRFELTAVYRPSRDELMLTSTATDPAPRDDEPQDDEPRPEVAREGAEGIPVAVPRELSSTRDDPDALDDPEDGDAGAELAGALLREPPSADRVVPGVEPEELELGSPADAADREPAPGAEERETARPAPGVAQRSTPSRPATSSGSTPVRPPAAQSRGVSNGLVPVPRDSPTIAPPLTRPPVTRPPVTPRPNASSPPGNGGGR